jgi:hypothetical protein
MSILQESRRSRHAVVHRGARAECQTVCRDVAPDPVYVPSYICCASGLRQ